MSLAAATNRTNPLAPCPSPSLATTSTNTYILEGRFSGQDLSPILEIALSCLLKPSLLEDLGVSKDC